MTDRTAPAAPLARHQALDLVQQATATRASLPALMRNVVDAARTLGAGQAALLVEANERLLVALLALSPVETATDADPSIPGSAEALASLNSVHRELSSLREQTELAQARLVQVRNALAHAEERLADKRAAAKVAADERLVRSSLELPLDAEDATQSPAAVSQAAEHDSLTRQPNRSAFLERVRTAVSHSRQHKTRFAVMFLNLDEFKQINDGSGQALGDAALKLAAERIAATIRDVNSVSWLGDDEFLVLITEMKQLADSEAVADQLIASLMAPCRIADHVLQLRARVGISLYPDDGADPETLIDRADAAMYLAKRRGVRRFAFQQVRPRASPIEPGGKLPDMRTAVAHLFDRETGGHQDVLREANQQLVLAAITAQDRQSAAEIAQEQQTRFLAVLAHELRAPLTPIRLAAGMMQSLPQLQAVIERQVFHITRLVSDLVDVSRVNAGKMRLERTLVDVKATIRSAAGIIQPTIDQRSQQLHCKMPPHEVTVQGDTVRLEQIIINLLDNASKYTQDSGEIRVELISSGTSISIIVSDTGIGIEADALLHIFDPFMQHPRAVEFNATGLGIGLAVVRELVEAHGGSVVASSSGVGMGSQFTVTLPVTV